MNLWAELFISPEYTRDRRVEAHATGERLANLKALVRIRRRDAPQPALVHEDTETGCGQTMGRLL